MRSALVCTVLSVTVVTASGCYESHQNVSVVWEADAGDATRPRDGGVTEPPIPLLCGAAVLEIALPIHEDCQRFVVRVPDADGYGCETVAGPADGRLVRLRLPPGEAVTLRYEAAAYLSDAPGSCNGRRCAFIAEVLESLCECGRFTSAALPETRHAFGPFDRGSQPTVLLGRGVEYQGEVCFID